MEVLKWHFPHLQCSATTYFAACMLHMSSTIFHAESSWVIASGLYAQSFLVTHGAEQSQARSVCEAIFRQECFGTRGQQTTLTAILRLAITMDNHLEHLCLLTSANRDRAHEMFPREGWDAWLAQYHAVELRAKPWVVMSWI